MKDDLVELLRKCHRDELLPLAEALRIKTEGMKLGTLARAIDHRLRRAAANDLENIVLRGGAGPGYPEVLRRVGLRLGLEVAVDPALAEQAIAREHMKRTWRMLPDHERGDLPEEPEEALRLLERRHPMTFGYHLTRLWQDPDIPLPGCLWVTWMTRPRWEIVLPAVLKVAHLRQSVRHRVTVGVVGSPSTGKDAAIAVLFGIDTGNVNPVAGSTKQVEITRLPDATALYVVNTPGMGDVVESVTEEAKQVLDHIDVYLYLINAQGGVQAREKADYDACVKRGRPVLAVVNKIDTLRDADRERYLTDARAKLGAKPEDFLAVAFDPLPQLSEAPIHVESVRDWIRRRLEALGKDPTELPWVTASPAP